MEIPVSSDSPLIVPYFEVDPQNLSGVSTLFAVRNETDDEIDVVYTYFSDGGNLPPETLALAGHATRTVNLRDVFQQGQGKITGYVQVTRTGQTLSGDFVLIPSKGDAAGGALVDAGPGRSPAQLCQLWDVRFLEGEPSDATTDFVFYLQNNTGTTATGRAYREADGALVKDDISVPISLRSLRLPASSLGLPAQAKSGSIEWDLGDGVVGNVSAVFMVDGGASVLVPGVCHDESP